MFQRQQISNIIKINIFYLIYKLPTSIIPIKYHSLLNLYPVMPGDAQITANLKLKFVISAS